MSGSTVLLYSNKSLSAPSFFSASHTLEEGEEGLGTRLAFHGVGCQWLCWF